jgi:hypothetical protein
MRQWIAFIFGLFVGLLLSGTVFADTNTLTWVNPTLDTTGKPVTLKSNKIYRGTKADGTDLALVATLTAPATSWQDANRGPGTDCYAVTAVADLESAKSAVACKTIAKPPVTPQAPTNFSNH